MERKAVSNIVSTVLVLSIAVSVAGVLATWGPGLVQDATDQTEEQTFDEIDCDSAGLRIESATYSSSSSELYLVVMNTGNIDLEDVRIVTWENGEIKSQDSGNSVVSGELRDFTISNIDSRPESVDVISSECPDVEEMEVL